MVADRAAFSHDRGPRRAGACAWTDAYNRRLAIRTLCPRIFVSQTAHAEPNSEPALPLAPLELENELAALMVEALHLELAPAALDRTAPLYGEGLGLDSIDILEVALEVSRRYGFQLRSDDADNQAIFASLRSLASHVARHRTR